MTAKEQKIKEAYGKYWERTKDYVDENGWVKIIHVFQINVFDNNFWQYSEPSLYRPKSLQGIENNNGWIRIESEEDLPESGYYEVVVRDSGEITRATLDNEFRSKSMCKYYSHYQPIVKIEPPIY